MARERLTQVVAFRTAMTVDGFVESWRPVAEGFLARGLETITLSSFEVGTGVGATVTAPAADGADGADGAGAVRFLSRNAWPEAAYRRTFPAGLAADGAAGGVNVVQAGVFARRSGGEEAAFAHPDDDLTVVLLRSAGHHADETVSLLLAALPADTSQRAAAYGGARAAQRFDVLVTVHGPAGTGARTAAALHDAVATSSSVGTGLVLAGRDVLTLTR